ncbi:MAG: SAM-dependent methyltransferase, partial [Mycobacterium sp.]
MVRSPVRSETLDKVGVSLVYRIGSTPIYKRIFRHWYPIMTRRLGEEEDVVFLNWGYEEDPP